MNIVKNILGKKHAKKWATLAIGGTLTFGAYSLARDIQYFILHPELPSKTNHHFKHKQKYSKSSPFLSLNLNPLNRTSPNRQSQNSKQNNHQ